MTQSVTRKHLFDLPDGVIYLDGNSLGPLPAAVPGHVARMVTDQWGQMLIKGWNDAGWFTQPGRVGDMIAGLIGAPAGSVVAGDTLSIKVYQALAAALQMNPDRRVVLTDSGNFPTDVYMAQGLLDLIGQGHQLRIVAPEDVAQAMTDDIAAVMLTQVDYRTGRRHDMASLTQAAHDAGAVMIWDLAHSAGAFEINLAGSGCAFAVGCTYKYLNGGPGAPAFIYVRPDLAETARPALQGWMGHNAPFAFDMDYQPAGGVARMRVGTPPVIQMSALEQALSVWEGVSLADVRTASVALMEQFIAEVEARCPQLTLASPRDPAQRGSHVSFRFDAGYAAMQALIDRGVIGDFRAPDIMRFGFTPLYLDADDITGAVDIMADILTTEAWRDAKYHVRGAVT
ncbi:kynureninase [Loktanella sp. M215]|uniref:kynureninase n=1 Tax=Loktanella sp. M215 TaxID=2675431 RepID=UPI001F0302C1|nr:kynureninase [Loktanella sp. M215]MCF7700832.1 kynureninase [Loktanella sp. M215]